LVPPLALRQYRIFHDGKKPLAFALWASLSEDGEKALLSGRGRLRPSDWRTGDKLWLVDMVTAGEPNPKLFQQLLADLEDGEASRNHIWAEGIEGCR
jgi:cytolysin-activating lysine-acyltransferase